MSMIVVPSLRAKMIFFNVAKNSWKMETGLLPQTPFHTKTTACLKYFLNDCLWKQFFASNSRQTTSNLMLLTIFPL